MATQQPGFRIGHEDAAADLSAKQFFCVKFTSTGVNLAGTGEAIDGILQDKPVSGQPADVMVTGVSKIVASAALAKGALVSCDAAGKAKAAATTEYIIGRLLEASGADGDVVSVSITRPGRLA